MAIQIKRAYEAVSPGDGFRVLVERLWPRGLTKEQARLDLWLKDIAPSTQLRQWFGHDPVRWSEFQRRYREELKKKVRLIDELAARASRGTVTLIYAARDGEHNSALVLQRLLPE